VRAGDLNDGASCRSTPILAPAILTRVSRDDEAAYVKQWAETGRLLEAQRWVELARLDPSSALEAADTLIEAALCVPLPASRRTWSGLVELQRILHRHPQ
jgi:hypothetical protein